MKISLAKFARPVLLLAPCVCLAQNGNMMDGGMGNFGWMGGYGGVWLPILLVVAVVGLVLVIVKRKGD